MEEIHFKNDTQQFSIKFFYQIKDYNNNDIVIEKTKLKIFKDSHYIQNNNISLIINYLLETADEAIENNDSIKANIFLKYSPIIRKEYNTLF